MKYLVFLAFLICPFCPAYSQFESFKFGKMYEGTIDTSRIRMLIGPPEEMKVGGYYFRFGDLKDHILIGNPNASNGYILYEKDINGNVLSTFWLLPGSSEFDSLYGDWTSADGKKLRVDLQGRWSYSFYSTAYDTITTVWDFGNPYSSSGGDLESEKNIEKFYTAVLKGDRKTAASVIHYPLRYNTKPGKAIIMRNKRSFLKNYDRMITPKFLASLKTDVPHLLFNNYQGIMIANGLVWFNNNGEAWAINKMP